MRTLQTSKWLLTALFTFAITVPGFRGFAAGDSPLVKAAKEDDLQAVRALIAKRANINEPARDGSTALLWAAYTGNLEMTRALLAAGAKVNIANDYGVTPLLQASRTGDAPIIQALLRAGADLNWAHPDGETPLMAVARTGRIDAIKMLLEAGADANAADIYQQQTPLMWAAEEGHLEAVKTLLAAGADPNRQAYITSLAERKHADHPTGGFTALMFAARNGHEEVVKTLVKGGADPKLYNGDGVTASVIAIVNDRFDLARTLLELGADANDGSLYFAIDMHDATHDMRARDGSRLRADHPNQLGALDLAKLLLERGADPNQPFVGQLHSTTLCCGEDINSSPIYRAAVAADVDALKLLLAHGAKVEWSPAPIKKEGGGRGANGNVGRTPVMMALSGGRGAPFAGGPGFERLVAPPWREKGNREPVEALKVLLAAGANPNAKAPDGSTPLHQAVTQRQVPIIRALVEGGAKLDAVNKDNLTPLQLAEKPEPAGRGDAPSNTDPDAYRRKQNTKAEVVTALRELMGLGPDDPTPVPPPAPPQEKKAGDAKEAGADENENQ
jgi:uncharacterized protein